MCASRHAAALDLAVDQGRDPGRIIAAVFETAQPLDQPGATASLAMIPMMRTSDLPPLPGPHIRRASRLVDLLPARNRQRVGENIAGDDAAGGHVRAAADRHGRNQHAVRANKGAFADCRAELVNAVIIAGDRAGADIRPRPDVAVADVGEVIGLGPGAEPP